MWYLRRPHDAAARLRLRLLQLFLVDDDGSVFLAGLSRLGGNPHRGFSLLTVRSPLHGPALMRHIGARTEVARLALIDQQQRFSVMREFAFGADLHLWYHFEARLQERSDQRPLDSWSLLERNVVATLLLLFTQLGRQALGGRGSVNALRTFARINRGRQKLATLDQFQLNQIAEVHRRTIVCFASARLDTKHASAHKAGLEMPALAIHEHDL